MSNKVLLTATVQSHICQFHKPLVNVLHRNGYEVHVAARDNLAEKNGLKLDFVEQVYDIPFSRSPLGRDNIKAYKEIKKILALNRYDYIHCNTPMGGVITRLAANKYRKEGTIVIYTVHGFHFYKGSPKINWIIYYPIEKILALYTDKLITMNREDYKLANSNFITEVYFIHGVGVDMHRYKPVNETDKKEKCKELGFDLDKKIILNVGELTPGKNQKMAIHAMQKVIERYSDVILLIAGNGPEKENLEKEIINCGLSKNIKLLGYCTNLEEYQNICDLNISCSKREGLPLNIIEAMLSENLIIATDIRGHRDLIIDGQDGFLFDLNNEDILVKRIIQALNDYELRSTLGENARKYAKKYSFEAVEEELEDIYFKQN